MNDGTATITARATDSAENVSTSPSRTIDVNNPPNTYLESGPWDTVSRTSARFEFSSSESNPTFECSLDGAAFEECSSPQEYTNIVAGPHKFEVRAMGTVEDTTPAVRSWTVDPDNTSQVLVGAGDIAACNSSGDEATAALLDDIPGTVFTVGDNVYDSGTEQEFANCYGPSWGRHKARTRPALGNHEYQTSNAAGYFGYFHGTAGNPDKGYYSYDLGSWHIIVTNSNCEQVGGCEAGSPQEQWLRADLAAHPTSCTLAVIHHPRFSSGGQPSSPAMQPFWQALYEHGAEFVVSGDAHNYQRFAPQNPSGGKDLGYGIRQFVVGTGGKSHYSINSPITNSEVYDTDSYGVLKLTLRADGYDWEFVQEAGKTFTDSGSAACHEPSATTAQQSIVSGPLGVTASVPTTFAYSSAVHRRVSHVLKKGGPMSHTARQDPAVAEGRRMRLHTLRQA